MILPPRLQRAGATSIYILRDDYDPELRLFARLLTPGMVVVDGGANIGVYTVVASKAVGHSGRVFSFEPGTVSFLALERNASLQPIRNVTLFRAALSDAPGEAKLFHIDSAPNSYSLAPDAETFELVPLMTLDGLVENQELDTLDVVKLDIEGAEELALRGAQFTLSALRPIVLFEVNPKRARQLGLESEGAWRVLEKCGYRLLTGISSGTVVPAAGPKAGNNLAFPRERDPAAFLSGIAS
jgi:FkbM family methyltransferase